MKVFLVFLFFTSSLAKYEYGLQCRTLECLDKEELIESLKYYQSKENQALVEGKWLTYKKKTSLLRFFRPDNAPDDDDNPTCNICNSHPCNNGTCQVDPNSPWRFYKCTCPGDTKGDNCELPITCQPDTCGPGANCYVANHQTNCVCPFGFSGNPNDPAVGCSQQTLQACAAGDPHYTTFDQLSFDYMGTCPSIFSAPCTSLAGGYDNFQVVTHSDFYGDSRTISVASQIEVTMWGQKIHIDAKKGAFFNGIEITPPYNWPSKDASNITVLFTADMYTIQNNQYVTVTFTSNGQLCVKVPNVPEMKGLGTLCGLAGNIDGNPYNDIVYRNGTVYLLTAADLPSLKYPVIQPVNECFDSWITDDFTSTSDSTTCATAQQITNNSNCEVLPAIATCSVIQLASNGSGPFYMCQAMGAGVIQNYYDNCVFDVCQQDKLKCNVFTNFVKACQLALPNTDVLNWRDTLSCQWVCSRGSHYSSCTSSCPATCADQTRPDTCNQGCFEGCECDAGEVIDNTNLLATTCISLHDCGCTDPQGNLHGAGTPWLDQNCTVLAQCANGTYFPEDTECSEYGYCGTDSQHRMACKCLSGFTGDGFNCTDIDECQDSASCSVDKGYGTCTNTIGSYNCTCNPYHYGRNCEVYKPKRHCADLQLYWGVMDDGAYLIYPPYAFRDLPAYSGLEVYCDMTQFGGGWTLLSHDSGSGMADHTFVEYVNGFGSGVDRWLGLEITHQMTQTESTSLLLAKITRCGYDFWTDTISDCTYPQFSVLNSTTTYAVVIPKKCTGTDKQYTGEFDGWARWELSQPGPAFQTFDQDTTIPKCSTVHKNVGFWYPVAQKDLCGPANLNGFRTSCNETAPDQKDLKPYDQYGGLLIADAWMYLRPQSYVPPPSPTTAPPPPPTTEIVPDTAPPAVNTAAPAPVTAAPAPVTAAPVPPI